MTHNLSLLSGNERKHIEYQRQAALLIHKLNRKMITRGYVNECIDIYLYAMQRRSGGI